MGHQPGSNDLRHEKGRGWAARPLLPLLVLCGFSSAQTELPPSAPEQPIPFSHRVHAQQGLRCLGCHEIKGKGFTAGYPSETACMACHRSVKTESAAIQKLNSFAREQKPVPWVKVYHVPDFVWFSHRSHHSEAGIDCEVCHGPVALRETLAKEKPTDMRSCMECHNRYGASNDCSFCHEFR